MLTANDISADFTGPNAYDAQVVRKVLKHEATPKALRCFANNCHGLSDYGYWFLLGTLWVSYTGWTDLWKWRELFQSDRPNRKTSLMKPSEVRAFDSLPDELTVYRAHREGETDWMSYTLDPMKAAWFASRRGRDVFGEYRLDKADAVALFTRRGESEVLSMDPASGRFVREVGVIINPAHVEERAV